jgi:hypothetical protein
MDDKFKLITVLSSTPLTTLQKKAFNEVQQEAEKAESKGIRLKFNLVCPNHKMTSCERFLFSLFHEQEVNFLKKVVILASNRDFAVQNHSDFLFSLKSMVSQGTRKLKMAISIEGKKWTLSNTDECKRHAATSNSSLIKLSSHSFPHEIDISFSGDIQWQKSLVKTAISLIDVDCVAIFLDQYQKKELTEVAKVCKELTCLIVNQDLLFKGKSSPVKSTETRRPTMLKSPITFQNKTIPTTHLLKETADFSEKLEQGISNKTDAQSKAFSETVRQISIHKEVSHNNRPASSQRSLIIEQ